MFGVLMITLLLTISLVGSNMDTILKQGVIYQVRAEITENTTIAQGFNDPEEFEKFVQQKIDERIKTLGLDTPCLLYTSPSPRDLSTSRMPSSA